MLVNTFRFLVSFATAFCSNFTRCIVFVVRAKINSAGGSCTIYEKYFLCHCLLVGRRTALISILETRVNVCRNRKRQGRTINHSTAVYWNYHNVITISPKLVDCRCCLCL